MTCTRPTADELRRLELFEGLANDHLTWLAEHGDCVVVRQGGRLVERGDPADFMFVVMEGVIQRHEEIGGQWLLVATTKPGQVTGMLPFSRMTHYPGHMVAVEGARVLRIRRTDFGNMLSVSTELGQRLVARMTDRVRGDVRLEQQREKLAALGRLSAGLAHELNNPAAAASRAAASLPNEVESLRAAAAALIRHGPDQVAMQCVRDLISTIEQAPCDRSGFARTEAEEALNDWLDAKGVAAAWDLGASFADAGLSVRDLESLATAVSADQLPDLLGWTGCELNLRTAARQVGSATARITELVASVKLYSHMDRSAAHSPTDVREGLDQTLVVLGHRLRQAGIVLTRTYEAVQPVPAHAGELNQVWTNLIENALDAMGRGGHLHLIVRVDHPWVCVEIIDDGPGVPDEIRSRIFEPFFTTKPVGEGFGLGLDIASRIVATHQGQIEVTSMPGRTTASVRLPLAPSTPPDLPANEGSR